MEKLTEAEKAIMDVLWDQEKAFMKDVIEALPEPKPAASTVATLLKRMQNKKLVGYKTYGNSREYFPMVAKGRYFTQEMNGLINRFFDSSVSQFASFFTANDKLSKAELEEIKEIIESAIEKKKA